LTNVRQSLPQLYSTIRYLAGLFYLFAAFGVIFPLALSFITELYIHIPVFTFLLSTASNESDNHLTPPAKPSISPTIFLLQSWTLGLLYLRLVLRLSLNYPSPTSRSAMAIRAITRRGYYHPDVKLATRAVIIPLTLSCIVLLVAPMVYAKFIITLTGTQDPNMKTRLHRFAYPGLLGVGLVAYSMILMKRKVDSWRVRIRDEVYLVGERLHNYVEKTERKFENDLNKDQKKSRERMTAIMTTADTE